MPMEFVIYNVCLQTTMLSLQRFGFLSNSRKKCFLLWQRGESLARSLVADQKTNPLNTAEHSVKATCWATVSYFHLDVVVVCVKLVGRLQKHG